MTKTPLLLVGAGGHARSCIDVIEMDGRFTVVGLVGQPHEVGLSVFGYTVLGQDGDLPALHRDCHHALVSVGQIKDPLPRMHLFDLLKQSGYDLPIMVSPRAHVSPYAVLGMGTVVMHGAIVNAGATVGCNCIINSQSLVEHDVIIADHCHVSTAAAVNSGVRIGEGTFIGSGSCVRQGVTIGERCVIGMGQRILTDCDAGTRHPIKKSL